MFYSRPVTLSSQSRDVKLARNLRQEPTKSEVQPRQRSQLARKEPRSEHTHGNFISSLLINQIDFSFKDGLSTVFSTKMLPILYYTF